MIFHGIQFSFTKVEQELELELVLNCLHLHVFCDCWRCLLACFAFIIARVCTVRTHVSYITPQHLLVLHPGNMYLLVASNSHLSCQVNLASFNLLTTARNAHIIQPIQQLSAIVGAFINQHPCFKHALINDDCRWCTYVGVSRRLLNLLAFEDLSGKCKQSCPLVVSCKWSFQGVQSRGLATLLHQV